MDYRYDMDVKYLLVEKDLKSKINQEVQVYDNNDIENICVELYKVDLLKVFRINEYNEKIILSKINELITLIEKDQNFNQIIEELQKKINNCEYQSSIYLFLFSYDLFYYFHIILQNFNRYKIIDDPIKNDLIKNINILL